MRGRAEPVTRSVTSAEAATVEALQPRPRNTSPIRTSVVLPSPSATTTSAIASSPWPRRIVA
jgi:hypothetical protein